MQNYKTGDLEVAHYRISKSAWLKEEEDEAVKRVSQRIEDMTGLTTSTAEELQVVNYGIGGHYEPHFDFARVTQLVHPIICTVVGELVKNLWKQVESMKIRLFHCL